MAFTFDATAQFSENYRRLCRKNAPFKQMVDLKVAQITEHLEFKPGHYKPMRGDLAGIRRVHVGSFVIFFEVKEKERMIVFLRIDHHDDAYK